MDGAHQTLGGVRGEAEHVNETGEMHFELAG